MVFAEGWLLCASNYALPKSARSGVDEYLLFVVRCAALNEIGLDFWGHLGPGTPAGGGGCATIYLDENTLIRRGRCTWIQQISTLILLERPRLGQPTNLNDIE